ncbi:hypothetical protein [Rhodococcus sp. NPDC057529]|uniref:hypothetical protein n=1 Tax=Rhodococcus sp. NPDC057529 TaxID=3346158 RepID=UPI00366FD94D
MAELARRRTVSAARHRPSDHAVPWTRVRVHTASAAEIERKNRAVAEFRSQIHPLSQDPRDAPILPPWVLARLTRATETVF